MKHTHKMVLVPEETVHRIENHGINEKSGLNRQIDEFRNELNKVIHNTNLSAEEQFKIYSQLFTRYLNMDSESKQPMKVLVQQDDSIPLNPHMEPDDQFTWPSTILNGFPKSLRSKAAMLIEEIKHNSNIEVNNLGEISVNGTYIPKSNIIDLIHDFTRHRKTKPAIGAEALAKIIKDSNIPREYVGNPDRLNPVSDSYKVEKPRRKSFNPDSNLEESWFDAPSVKRPSSPESPNVTLREHTPRSIFKATSRRKIKYEGL